MAIGMLHGVVDFETSERNATRKGLLLPVRKKREKSQGVVNMFTVSYSREEGTDLYRVTFHQIGQTIVLSRHILVEKIGMDPRVLVGCKDLSIHVIIDLGFILPIKDNRLVV